MLNVISPDLHAHRTLTRAAKAEIDLCYACGTCLVACPVNRATGRLAPLRLVRMAIFGLVEELLNTPDIWYCQGCNACAHNCPMTVKPGALISYLRRESSIQHLLDPAKLARFDTLWTLFQRVRWHAADECRHHRERALTASEWQDWANTPVPPDRSPVLLAHRPDPPANLSTDLNRTDVAVCFTCGECRGQCPVFRESGVFDPLAIFRQVNLGLIEPVLESPSIWLCLGCQRCSNQCVQRVRGHEMFQVLQGLALENGFCGRKFPTALGRDSEELVRSVAGRNR